MRKTWLFIIVILVSLFSGSWIGFHIGAATGIFQPTQAQPYAKRVSDFFLLFMDGKMCAEDDECGFNNIENRIQLPCQPFTKHDPRTMVIFAFGQSNSANHGDFLHGKVQGVYNLNPFDGLCYQAQDPLLGATGEQGSVWLPMAEKLITSGQADQVLIVPFGVGGSSIERWTPTGDLSGRIKRSLEAINKHNIKATHVVWHQGETDAAKGTSTEEYITLFGEVISQLEPLGLDIPIYSAVATLCGTETMNKKISNAQQQLPDVYSNVFPGANSDLLGSDMRFDNCHFNQQGLTQHAQLWFEALTY